MSNSVRTTVAILALTMATTLWAQRLPIRSYAASDGLPGSGISQITHDAHGFLWCCGAEGAARFDGSRFTPIGEPHGWPSKVIHELVQTQDGCYWLATEAGVCRLNPALPSGRSRTLPVPGGGTAYRLLADAAGVLWCGTSSGLFRVDQTSGRESLIPVELGLPRRLFDDPIVSTLAEKAGGGLWIGAGSAVYALDPDGNVRRFTASDGLPPGLVRSLAAARDGTLYVATAQGIGRFRMLPGATTLGTVDRFTTANGLSSPDVLALLLSRDGRLLAGTAKGLTVLDHGAIQNFGLDQGVNVPVFTLSEDRSGDLWMGSDRGVQRWSRTGLATYSPKEAGTDPRLDSVMEDQGGTLVAVSAGKGTVFLHSLRGNELETARLRLPAGVSDPGWGWNQRLLQDHLGDWWVATDAGLCRFDHAMTAVALPHARHRRTYQVSAVAGMDSVFAVFEDSRGDIWFSVSSPVTNGLGRWRRIQDRLEGFHEQDGLPRMFNSLPSAFAEDRAGQVWVAFAGAGLARFRNGHFDLFTKEHGVPEGAIRSLLVDGSGRLWLASSRGGVGLLEDPGAERPQIRTFTTAQGLASNSAWSLVEDSWGRIYVGTGAGVDRLDLEHARVFHLTEAGELDPGIPRGAHRDRQGTLWFATSRGLSRYIPSAPKPTEAPPIYMTGLRVAGTPGLLPESGTGDWELADIPPHRNRIQVDFTSPGGLGVDTLRFQYRLEGISDDWSPPGSGRSVDFANLAPGHYHFQVRAVGAEGTWSEPPAELRFKVLPPIWLRWWFLSLAGGSLLGLVWLGYRSRLRQLLEVERIRTRIAADLHDDIGASLSRIAILSEVVKSRTPESQTETTRFLAEIAESSRDLVDSMGEIVWSIDPRRDNLKHLLARVGQFASGALEARGLRWSMTLPPDPRRVKLAPEARRGTYLILKEAITNALKHSGGHSVHLLVEVGNGLLVAQVRDDGSGLPAEPAGWEASTSRRGHGLINMHVRAKEMGGRLEVISGPDGTTVRLELPHKKLMGA